MNKIDFKIKNKMDKLFIEGGYVMDYSNSSFQNFILESVEENIYDKKYDEFGDSKGNRLRCFWSDAGIEKVIKLSLDLLDYWNDFIPEKTEADLKSYNSCKNYFKKILDSGCELVKVSIKTKLDDSVLSHKFISEQIEKANKKVEEADYSGAITNARTLIEQVLKELNKKLNLEIEYKGNLPKLYKEISNAMNIKAESNSLGSIKKIVSGFINTVSGLSTLRNEASDAHGREINPERHHAKLAVNCSLTICDFILDSYEYQLKRNKI